MNLITKLYLKRINYLLDIGFKNGLIEPYDDDLYRELNQTIFSAIPVDLDIKYLKPKEAIISCGKNNKYGHPHKETLSTLKSNNVSIRRTDKEGTINYLNYF